MVQKVSKIWQDGKLIDWDDAQDHILTHTTHYGLGVFEGIRCYLTDQGPAIFRLREHIERLFKSSKICTLEVPFSVEDIIEACKAVLPANGLKEAYIRPIVYMGDGGMGLGSMNNPTKVSVITWEWGAYLGDDGIKNGIRTKTSTFLRPHMNSSMVRGKINGQYVTSILAKREAIKDGYQEALMLDQYGHVVEGTGENLFVIKDGKVYTPGLDKSILEGITRDTAIKILKDNNVDVIEQAFTRDTLYTADEIFLTGTAAEVTPIRELDRREIGTGKPGPITKLVQDEYFATIRGKREKYISWLTFVN